MTSEVSGPDELGDVSPCLSECSKCLSTVLLSKPSHCGLLQSLLSDNSAEIVGQNFLAVSPTTGVPEPDFVEMTAEAPAQAAVHLASPLEVASPPCLASFMTEAAVVQNCPCCT